MKLIVPAYMQEICQGFSKVLGENTRTKSVHLARICTRRRKTGVIFFLTGYHLANSRDWAVILLRMPSFRWCSNCSKYFSER